MDSKKFVWIDATEQTSEVLDDPIGVSGIGLGLDPVGMTGVYVPVVVMVCKAK